MSRIYRVFDIVAGAVYLVRARSQSQAIRHVVADRFAARVADQETIVEMLTAGGVVLDATRDPEPAEATQD